MSPRTAPVTLKILNASEAEGLVIYGLSSGGGPSE